MPPALNLMPVIGIDEVGRGPLAGPVTACAVFLPANYNRRKLPKNCLKDSKVMTAAQRDDSFMRITGIAFYALGHADVLEIENFNIRGATHLAMKRALSTLLVANQNHDAFQQIFEVWIDGNDAPKFDACPHSSKHIVKTMIGGDGKIAAISAASIVAKVTRDRIMQSLANDHPEYGWCKNAGYATRHHVDAIRNHGVTPHHRSLFLRKILAQN